MLYQIPANSNEKICTKYVTTKCFKDEEIKKIIESLKPGAWRDAGVYQNPEAGTINKSHRKCEIQLLEKLLQQVDIEECEIKLLSYEVEDFPLPQITHQISNINNNFWNFDIRYIPMREDSPAVFKYPIGGKFNWHMDITPAAATRKLSYSIQLSDTNDYEGGDLEFFDGDNTGKKEKNPQLRQKGNIIVFPSYLWHRITPITKGIRYAIVGWIHGPTYR